MKAAQVAISALSLTYNAEPGVQDIYLDARQDMVAIPDMSRFIMEGRFGELAQAESYAAHILGDIGSSYTYSMLPEEPLTDLPVATHPSSFWNATDHWEYTFVNSAPGQGPQDFSFLSAFSNQSITSSATCHTPSYDFSTNYTADTVTIKQKDPGNDRVIIFPNSAGLEERIIYLTTPLYIEDGRPQSGKQTGHCGPGCSTIHILEVATGPPAADSFARPDAGFYYYECNTTVAPKGGAPQAAGHFNFSATRAAIAAQAIALSGRAYLGQGATANMPYNLGLPFGEAQNNSAAGMAALVSRFAIGVVAAAAQTSRRILVPGRPPRQGVRLVLERAAAFAAVVGAMLGTHLVFLVLAAVLVKGDWGFLRDLGA